MERRVQAVLVACMVLISGCGVSSGGSAASGGNAGSGGSAGTGGTAGSGGTAGAGGAAGMGGGQPGTCPTDVAVQVGSHCFQKGIAGINNLPETGTTYEDVVAYCDDLELGGHTTWTLPNINELRTLIEGCFNDCPVSDPVCLHPIDCAPPSCVDCGDDLEGPGEDGCFLDPAFTGGCERTLCSSSTSFYNEQEIVWEILPVRGDIDSQLLRDERRIGCDARCVLK